MLTSSVVFVSFLRSCRRLFLPVSLCFGTVFAQQPQPPRQPQPEAPKEAQAPKPAAPAPQGQPNQTGSTTQQAPREKSRMYVRRFSAGLMVSVFVWPQVKPGGLSQTVDTRLSISSDTTADNRRVGFGAVAQLALTQRFALAVSGTRHNTGFTASNTTIEGVDLAGTAQDDRRFTTNRDVVTARLFDFTGLLRRYSKDRDERGARWFFEGGASIRKVSQIRAARTTTINDATPVESQVTLAPAHKTARGVVAGLGAQFVDDIGIRVVPEVRYTRWLDRTFDNLSTRSRADQVQATVSFTF